jgi:hemolysin activation/secretion protein
LAPRRALLAAGLALAAMPVGAQAPVPSIYELEATGAIVGAIRVRPQNIFDTDDPAENYAVFRFFNRIHPVTRPKVIERSLLFKEGERLSVQRLEETERLLRSNRYLYDVDIVPIAYRDGVVDLEVVTRDTWSLRPEIDIERSGGVTTGSLGVEERNFLGTGVAVGLSRISEVDHEGTQFSISDRHAFGPFIGLDYAYADLDTGHNQAFSLAKPFYALDVRSAGAFSLAQGTRIDPVYQAGEVVAEYRHTVEALDTSLGWSAGLIEGWTRRFSGGYRYQDDRYAIDPQRTPPSSLPEDSTLSGPYLRFEVIQDDFRKLKNLDLIERPEFFALGHHSSVQVQRALEELGSKRDSWVYGLTWSDGATPRSDQIVLASLSLSGRYDSAAHRRQLSGSVRYYARHGPDALFFASFSGAVSKSPDISDVLQLGGDNGLRGYPLRYQTGEQRVVLTFEERGYTDWYPLRLFRVGGAVFFDIGRAWGGPFPQGNAYPDWLSDVGVGLRILSTRSAFGNVLHADLAFPLQSGPNIQKYEFSFKTKATF